MAKTTTTTEEVVKPSNDAFTGMLAISLIAMLIGCALLYLDLNQYDWKKDPPPPAKYQPKAKEPAADKGGEKP